MAGDPSDAQIEELLRAVPAERWHELWAAFDAVDPARTHTLWEGGQQAGTVVVDGVEKPVHQVPYAAYSDEVERLLRAISGCGLVVPFAWPDWDGLERYRGALDSGVLFSTLNRIRGSLSAPDH